MDVTARNMLSKMPGIFAGNIDAVAAKAGTLGNLILNFSVDEYAPVMGKKNAQDLARFLERTYKEEAK